MHAPDVPFTLVDFLSECAFDLQAQRLRPLAHYLKRYPSHTEAVAHEYLALIDDADRPVEAAKTIGRFELLRELARGGQGSVHLARDPSLSRFVAIKVLNLTGATDTVRRERFRREVAAVVRLDHPHVCRLFEADVEHEPPYAAMELVPGRSLAQLLALDERTHDASGGLVEPRTTAQRAAFLRYFEQVARAMHAVHGAGIVHRDIKPANLMLTADGQPRVLDFGLASAAERTGLVTITDAMLGTLPYMAPEQLVESGKIDRRTDVFALGVTMFECFTRQRPFGGVAPSSRRESIAAGPPWRLLRRLPADLRAITCKALAFDPEHRYPSGEALAQDLQRAREHRPVSARRASWLLASGRWCRRHPWLTGWLVTCAIAIAATLHANQVSQVALVASQKLEQGVLETVRSFDPWQGGRDDTSLADSGLRRSLTIEGDAIQRFAMLQLRRGDIAAARRELEQPGAPRDERTLALQLACQLIERAKGSENLPVAMPQGDPVILAQHLAEIAGELCRTSTTGWDFFDGLTKSALAMLEAPELRLSRLRTPLRLWQLQAASIRGAWLSLAGIFVGERKLLSEQHGEDGEETLEFELAFLAVAAEVVRNPPPMNMVRLRAERLMQKHGNDGDDRSRRIKSLALSITSGRDPGTLESLEAVREEQFQQLGPTHPDSIETTRRMACWLRSVNPERSHELFAEALEAAEHLPPEAAELRAMVLQGFACQPNPTKPADEVAVVRAEAVRLCLRLWGPHDRRTLDALCDELLDPERIPEGTAWLQDSLADLTRISERLDDQHRVVVSLLRRALHQGHRLAAEHHALALQAGPQALELGWPRHVRASLASQWLADHSWLAGDDLVQGMQQAAGEWRARLGKDDPGEGFVAEMQLAAGKQLMANGWLADAGALLHAATHAVARELAEDVADDWRAAAESLPTPHPRTGDLLQALAWWSEHSGDDQTAIRLLRRALPARSSKDRINGTNWPDHKGLWQLSRLLIRTGDYVAAEVELKRCLETHTGRGEHWLAPGTYKLLLILYTVSDQPKLAAETSQRLGK